MGHDVYSIGSPLGDPQQSNEKNIPWTSPFWMANVHLEFGAEVSEKLPYYDANAAPDALWGQPSANGCRNQATRLPTGAWHWWHGDKVVKTSCPAPRRPRYRRDMRSPPPTDTSCTARARTPDHEKIRTRTTHSFRGHVATSAPRTRSLPQPTPHEPTTKRKNERTTEDPPV